MTRLILALVLLAAILLVVNEVSRFLMMAGLRPAPRREDSMPALFRNLAYGLLLALMLGISTGWLGGL